MPPIPSSLDVLKIPTGTQQTQEESRAWSVLLTRHSVLFANPEHGTALCLVRVSDKRGGRLVNGGEQQ